MARKADHRLTATIASVFDKAADHRPSHCALICGEDSISYAELDRRANQLAHHLIGLGCRPGSLVALLLERSIDAFVALLAICKTGAAFVPLGADNPPQRVAHILKDSSAQILISRLQLCAGLAGSHELLDLSDVGSKVLAQPTRRPLATVRHEDLAYCIYTSGSTGAPKGVMVTHQGIVDLCAAQRALFGVSSEDRVLQFASLGFDAFVFEVLMAFGSAATLVIRGEQLGEPLVREMDRHGVTIATLPPSLLARTDLTTLARLRCVIVAGEACPPAYVDATPPGCVFVNAYGPTEATIWSTAFRVPRSSRLAELPIGRPVGATGALILDPHLQPVPPGVTGEIFLTGPGLARGYRNRPDLTAERFLPCPDGPPGSRMYRTGDLGRWNEAGWIEFRGRTDHQVKLHGFRIELGEVELALADLSGVKAAAAFVTGVGPEASLVAHLESSELSASDLSRIEASLMQRLPSYMIPSRWAITDSLPLNPSGKVDRSALQSVPTLPATGRQSYEEPRPGIETAVAAIWRRVLNLRQVGRTDGFRTLGGSSIQGVIVSFAAGKELGKTVPTPRGDQSLAEYASAIEAAVQVSSHNCPGPSSWDPERLSFAQEQVCFLEAAGDAWRAYRCHARLDFKGALDVRALKQAIEKLVARHEILRTTFAQHQGTWRREVEPDVRVALPFTDLSHLEADRAAASLEQCIREDLDCKFDLSFAPLVHWHLVRVQSDTHVLLQSEHHNVHDGQSFRILVRDLADLYSSSVLGRPDGLPPVEAQYGDFCADEQRWSRSDGFRQSVLAWKAELEGFLPDSQPFTRGRAGLARRHLGNQERCLVDAGLFDSLRQVATRIGVSRYALMLAAFGALCVRLSQQNKFLVGSALANRTASQFQQTVGMFVNMLPIPFNVDLASSFQELAIATGRRVDFALTHSRVPMSELVKELGWGTSLRGRSPFNLGFSFHDSMRAAPRFAGLETTLTEALPNGSSKFDLSVVGILSNDTSPDPMELIFEYDTDTFTQEAVQRMALQFKALLRAVVANPQCRIEDLALITQEERHRILVEWNDTRAYFPQDKCIHQLFEEQAGRTPDAVAVDFEGDQLTYAQLNAQADQLARHVQGLGVGPNKRVAIALTRSMELVAAMLATLKAGGAYIPLDPAYPSQRLHCMLQDSAPVVLLSTRAVSGQLSLPEGLTTVWLDGQDRPWERMPAGRPVPRARPRDAVYVTYTSGSTGQPKGAVVEHIQLTNLVHWHQRRFGLGRGDRCTSTAGLGFDAFAWEVWSVLCSGATLLLAPRSADAETIVDWWWQQEIDVSFLVTPLAELALSRSARKPRLRALLTGGDRLGPLNRSVPFEVVNNYGPTECTVVATSGTVSGDSRAPSIGRPIDNTQIYILDARGREVPVGVAGEIHIGGAQVARGYLNRPDLTAERFLPNPFGERGSRMYKSGDLARYLPDGSIEFLGRNDHQVKLRGFRIELGEIEASLRACEGVKDALVVAHGEHDDRQLFGFLMAPQAEALKTSDVRATIARSLPAHMLPAVFVAVNAWPIDANGKIDRLQLLSLALSVSPTEPAAVHQMHDSAQPTDDDEVRVIMNILRDLIPGIKLAPDDDLIASGLHSLATMRFVARCEDAFGVGLRVRDVYRLVSPNAIAAAIRAERTGA